MTRDDAKRVFEVAENITDAAAKHYCFIDDTEYRTIHRTTLVANVTEMAALLGFRLTVKKSLLH